MTNINHQISRIFSLYRHLPREPESLVSVGELKQHVITSYSANQDLADASIHKAIRRDIEALNKVLQSGSVEIVKGKGNQADLLRLSADACIEQMSKESALMMVMAQQFLAAYVPHVVFDKCHGLFQHASNQLKRASNLADWTSRFRVVNQFHFPFQKTKNMSVEKIYEALLRQDVWIKCQYCKEYGDDFSDYVLKLHGIIFNANRPYLMASKIINNKSELRTFNLAQFKDVEIIPERIVVDVKNHDLDDLVAQQEYEDAYFNHEMVRIIIRFPEEFLPYVDLNPLHPEQKCILHDTEHDYVEMLIDCIVTTSVMNWLIINSNKVMVMEPIALNYLLRQQLSFRAEFYENCLNEVIEKFEYEQKILSMGGTLAVQTLASMTATYEEKITSDVSTFAACKQSVFDDLDKY